jgi:hypothetical protein
VPRQSVVSCPGFNEPRRIYIVPDEGSAGAANKLPVQKSIKIAQLIPDKKADFSPQITLDLEKNPIPTIIAPL